MSVNRIPLSDGRENLHPRGEAFTFDPARGNNVWVRVSHDQSTSLSWRRHLAALASAVAKVLAPVHGNHSPLGENPLDVLAERGDAAMHLLASEVLPRMQDARDMLPLPAFPSGYLFLHYAFETKEAKKARESGLAFHRPKGSKFITELVKGTEYTLRCDPYLYGHPSGTHKFRSANECTPHFMWLLYGWYATHEAPTPMTESEWKARDVMLCKCDYCPIYISHFVENIYLPLTRPMVLQLGTSRARYNVAAPSAIFRMHERVWARVIVGHDKQLDSRKVSVALPVFVSLIDEATKPFGLNVLRDTEMQGQVTYWPCEIIGRTLVLDQVVDAMFDKMSKKRLTDGKMGAGIEDKPRDPPYIIQYKIRLLGFPEIEGDGEEPENVLNGVTSGSLQPYLSKPGTTGVALHRDLSEEDKLFYEGALEEGVREIQKSSFHWSAEGDTGVLFGTELFRIGDILRLRPTTNNDIVESVIRVERFDLSDPAMVHVIGCRWERDEAFCISMDNVQTRMQSWKMVDQKTNADVSLKQIAGRMYPIVHPGVKTHNLNAAAYWYDWKGIVDDRSFMPASIPRSSQLIASNFDDSDILPSKIVQALTYSRKPMKRIGGPQTSPLVGKVIVPAKRRASEPFHNSKLSASVSKKLKPSNSQSRPGSVLGFSDTFDAKKRKIRHLEEDEISSDSCEERLVKKAKPPSQPRVTSANKDSNADAGPSTKAPTSVKKSQPKLSSGLSSGQSTSPQSVKPSSSGKIRPQPVFLASVTAEAAVPGSLQFPLVNSQFVRARISLPDASMQKFQTSTSSATDAKGKGVERQVTSLASAFVRSTIKASEHHSSNQRIEVANDLTNDFEIGPTQSEFAPHYTLPLASEEEEQVKMLIGNHQRSLFPHPIADSFKKFVDEFAAATRSCNSLSSIVAERALKPESFRGMNFEFILPKSIRDRFQDLKKGFIIHGANRSTVAATNAKFIDVMVHVINMEKRKVMENPIESIQYATSGNDKTNEKAVSKSVEQSKSQELASSRPLNGTMAVEVASVPPSAGTTGKDTSTTSAAKLLPMGGMLPGKTSASKQSTAANTKTTLQTLLDSQPTSVPANSAPQPASVLSSDSSTDKLLRMPSMTTATVTSQPQGGSIILAQASAPSSTGSDLLKVVPSDATVIVTAPSSQALPTSVPSRLPNKSISTTINTPSLLAASMPLRSSSSSAGTTASASSTTSHLPSEKTPSAAPKPWASIKINVPAPSSPKIPFPSSISSIGISSKWPHTKNSISTLLKPSAPLEALQKPWLGSATFSKNPGNAIKAANEEKGHSVTPLSSAKTVPPIATSPVFATAPSRAIEPHGLPGNVAVPVPREAPTPISASSADSNVISTINLKPVTSSVSARVASQQATISISASTLAIAAQDGNTPVATSVIPKSSNSMLASMSRADIVPQEAPIPVLTSVSRPQKISHPVTTVESVVNFGSGKARLPISTASTKIVTKASAATSTNSDDQKFHGSVSTTVLPIDFDASKKATSISTSSSTYGVPRNATTPAVIPASVRKLAHQNLADSVSVSSTVVSADMVVATPSIAATILASKNDHTSQSSAPAGPAFVCAIEGCNRSYDTLAHFTRHQVTKWIQCESVGCTFKAHRPVTLKLFPHPHVKPPTAEYPAAAPTPSQGMKAGIIQPSSALQGSSKEPHATSAVSVALTTSANKINSQTPVVLSTANSPLLPPAFQPIRKSAVSTDKLASSPQPLLSGSRRLSLTSKTGVRGSSEALNVAVGRDKPKDALQSQSDRRTSSRESLAPTKVPTLAPAPQLETFANTGLALQRSRSSSQQGPAVSTLELDSKVLEGLVSLPLGPSSSSISSVQHEQVAGQGLNIRNNVIAAASTPTPSDRGGRLGPVQTKTGSSSSLPRQSSVPPALLTSKGSAVLQDPVAAFSPSVISIIGSSSTAANLAFTAQEDEKLSHVRSSSAVMPGISAEGILQKGATSSKPKSTSASINIQPKGRPSPDSSIPSSSAAEGTAPATTRNSAGAYVCMLEGCARAYPSLEALNKHRSAKVIQCPNCSFSAHRMQTIHEHGVEAHNISIMYDQK